MRSVAAHYRLDSQTLSALCQSIEQTDTYLARIRSSLVINVNYSCRFLLPHQY